MEKAILIVYTWELDDHPDLDEQTKEKLDKFAQRIIFNSIQTGKNSGGLHYATDVGLNVKGYWKVNIY